MIYVMRQSLLTQWWMLTSGWCAILVAAVDALRQSKVKSPSADAILSG